MFEIICDKKIFADLKRTTLALYVVGLVLCVCSILTLLMGCSNSSHRLITVTGVFLFFAGNFAFLTLFISKPDEVGGIFPASFVAAAIGVWHKSVQLDEEILAETPQNFRNWDEVRCQSRP